MEHESFENGDIAQILNDHFVSIKVDREERPDVDRVYMTYLQVSAIAEKCSFDFVMNACSSRRPKAEAVGRSQSG